MVFPEASCKSRNFLSAVFKAGIVLHILSFFIIHCFSNEKPAKMKPPLQEATLGAPRTCAQGHAWSCVFGVQIEPKDSLSTGPVPRGIRKGTLSTDVWPRESPGGPGRPTCAISLTFARSPLHVSVPVRLKRIKKPSCFKSNMHYKSNMRYKSNHEETWSRPAGRQTAGAMP